ncbi:hypothetical protein BAOM_3404 [Peribacillus asahii]|uniref:Uncharacterized protein n=1 Tax=Peribacillus asahii TaxID=228899 RepID=A0A3T0KUU8_9BACI|nr:hypothetical protein BAOM_3404 [Peribacillus asahii]
MIICAGWLKIVNKYKYKVNSIIKRMVNEEINHEALSNK